MDIILGGVGIVIVDDELDIFHVFWIKSNWFYSVEERRKYDNVTGEKLPEKRMQQLMNCVIYIYIFIYTHTQIGVKLFLLDLHQLCCL